MPNPADLQQLFAGVLTPLQLQAQEQQRRDAIAAHYAGDTERPWRFVLENSLNNLSQALPNSPYQQMQQKAQQNQAVLQSATKGYAEKVKSGMPMEDAQLAVLGDAIDQFSQQGNWDAISSLAPQYMALMAKRTEIAKLKQETDTSASSQIKNIAEARKAAVETALEPSKAQAETDYKKTLAAQARQSMATYDTNDILDLTNPQAGPVTARINKDGSAMIVGDDGQAKVLQPGQYRSAPSDANGGTGGARAQIYAQRILGAANEAVAAAKNIMELPVSASTGWFGTAEPGHGLLTSSKTVLSQKVTSQDVQDYQTMITGVTRNLAAIEAAGLAPAGSLTKAMEGVVIKEGDSNITKLRRMAEIRQIVEQSLDTQMNSPTLTDQQKQMAQQIMAQFKEAIPFTQHDVTQLQRSKNPNATIADFAQKSGAAKPSAAPAAGWKVERVQ